MEPASAILVVEDDELVRSFLCRALAGVASTVDACGDGASVLRMIQSRAYGLILLDGLLPDVHGVDLGQSLIAHPATRRSALCLVSGSLRSTHQPHHGIAALPKPLHLRELIATAQDLLAWSRTTESEPQRRTAVLSAIGDGLLVR